MGLTSRQRAYLQAMEIDVFAPRETTTAALFPEQPRGDTPSIELPPAMTDRQADTIDWTQLQAIVRECRACELHATRTQTVFGVGNPQAQILFIGEAPGADEDRQGEPFVGRAGQLLNEMLRAIQLQRSDVYIANILKCRPPNNRDPKPEEAAQCWPYLKRQIELIQPRLLVALGRIAAQRLLQTDAPLTRLRQKVHQQTEFAVPMIVTYHPAYLLRTPQDKRKAWEDLLFLQHTLAEITR